VYFQVLAAGAHASVPWDRIPGTEQAGGVAALNVPMHLNLLAVTVGALVGTLTAAKDEDIDVVGMFALALCYGFGGGLMRDFFLGSLPPAALKEPTYLMAVLITTVVGSVFLVYLDHFERPLAIVDALSIGLSQRSARTPHCARGWRPCPRF
jgi:uncharacterized membrane protein YeaQ/YmgE (transglycosylase-associated protein family)